MKRVLCCGWLALLLALPVLAQPEILLEETAIEVSVAPGGAIALLGIERHVSNGVAVVSYYTEVLADEDEDGIVSPEFDRDIAWQSTWAAIDLATGAFAVAGPPGYSFEVFGLPESLHPGAAALANASRNSRLLVVRPEQGAWWTEVRDGALNDVGGELPGSVAAALEIFEPLGDPSPPTLHSLKPEDVVAMLDLRTHALSIGVIDPSGRR